MFRAKAGEHSNHWPEARMIHYLHQLGYDTRKVGTDDVANCKEYVTSPLTRSHVFLMLCRILHRENSWLVLFNGMCFHNFEMLAFDYMEMLNRPIVANYLVRHPSWMDAGWGKGRVGRERWEQSIDVTKGKAWTRKS